MKERIDSAMRDREVGSCTGGERLRPWQRLLLGAALLSLTILLFITGAVRGSGDAEAPMKMKIAKHIHVFPPNVQLSWAPGDDGILPKSAPAPIVVETNNPEWMLTVSFRLPDVEARFELPARWTCALLDARGELISEVFVKKGLAVLPGNGLCGRHEVRVQLQGPGDAHGGQAPAGLIAEIKGEEVTEARR